MPDELASDAGAGGSFARNASNAASCASLAGCCGSSAQARWLITSPTAMPSKASGVADSRSTSAGGRPSRDMPLSTCSVAGSLRPARLAAAAPGLDLLDAVQHRNGTGRDAGVFGAGRYTVEHMDFGAPPSAARSVSASPSCATKNTVAAFGAERRGNLGRAQPVAVGLDDGCRSRAAELALEDPVVLADRPEVDRQDCAGHSR